MKRLDKLVLRYNFISVSAGRPRYTLKNRLLATGALILMQAVLRYPPLCKDAIADYNQFPSLAPQLSSKAGV